ncbi:MAG TPA: hypothetical protein VF041_17480 [Gemmatimonadaceae bacterium]
MRSFVPVGTLLCALAACAPRPATDVAPEPAEPLRVLLHPPLPADEGRSLSFVLNRPAYVALFEVIPGRGSRVLYPWIGSTGREFSEGYGFAYLTPFRFADYQPGTPFVTGWDEPRFLYVVASSRPLRVQPYTRPGALRRYMGLSRFMSYRPFATMDLLTRAVLPEQIADDEWASDVFIDWGANPLSMAPRFAWRVLRCQNGRMLVIPAAYEAASCPGDALRATTVIARRAPGGGVVLPPGTSVALAARLPRPTSMATADLAARMAQRGVAERGVRSVARSSDRGVRRDPPPRTLTPRPPATHGTTSAPRTSTPHPASAPASPHAAGRAGARGTPPTRQR